MDKKKISVIVEIIVFILVLGGITFFYYFGNNKKTEESASEVGIIKVNDDNFESEVLKSAKPVVVEFSSNMCPPCLTMIPTLINIAKNNKDVKVVTINTSDDDTKNVSKKYEIEATPTIMIIKNSEIIKTFTGATNESTIMQELREAK